MSIWYISRSLAIRVILGIPVEEGEQVPCAENLFGFFCLFVCLFVFC